VLRADDFPELSADLVAALPALNVENLAHLERTGSGEKETQRPGAAEQADRGEARPDLPRIRVRVRVRVRVSRSSADCGYGGSGALYI
jgi:hypothetical protein